MPLDSRLRGNDGILLTCQCEINISLCVLCGNDFGFLCAFVPWRDIDYFAALNKQLRQFLPRLRRHHEGLSYQKRMHAVAAHERNIFTCMNAALCYQDPVIRYPAGKAERHFQMCFEGTQITVVDPDQPGRQGKCAIHLVGIMHLNQRIHTQVVRQLQQFQQHPVRERSNDQQNAIGTQCPRLVHLVGIDQEILAQYRQTAGCTRLLQEGVRPREKIDIGQYRKAGGTAALITCGNLRRIKILAQDTATRRGLLDLRDYGGLVC